MNIKEGLKKFISENLMLIAIMVCVTISILSRSYFDLTYISPDSAHYLRAAREILRGNGFYVYPEWFANWPIGYPVLIALVAFFTRTEVYLASKILSIIIVWLIGVMFYRRFGRMAWVFALVMLNVGFRYIFFYSWSETVFLLGMFLLVFTAVDIICGEGVRISHYIWLTFIVILLFLSRYIGAFALMVTGSLWLINLIAAIRLKCKDAFKRVLFLSGSGLVSGVFILLYLLLNQRQSGYMTGLPRVPAGPARELFLDLYRAMLIEMDFVFDTFFSIGAARLALILWFVLIGFFIYSISRCKEVIINREKGIITSLCFIFVGVIYWVSIVLMRFVSDFDEFGFRLLFPASAMFFVGFVSLLIRNEKIASVFVCFSGKIIPVICLTGFLLMMLVITPRLQGTFGYRKVFEMTLDKYSSIPDGALVLWGDTVHPLFMRDNLWVEHPGLELDLDVFWQKYGKYQEIYVYVPGLNLKLGEYYLNTEFYAYFSQFLDSQEVFVQIK